MECMTLVFGDLHLEHICEWSEEEFINNYLLEYPLWQITYETLLNDLEESGVCGDCGGVKARHALY